MRFAEFEVPAHATAIDFISDLHLSGEAPRTFERWAGYLRDNADFFEETLPGRDHAIGSPGGAAKLGIVPADAPLVAAQPPGPADAS